MSRGRPTIISTVIVVMSALLLVSGCAAKTKPTSPCPSASAQALAYIAQATAAAPSPSLVPVPAFGDPLDQLDANTRNDDAIQAASVAAVTASEQAKLLAAYVEVQHASCFSDADIAQAQLWIDHFK